LIDMKFLLLVFSLLISTSFYSQTTEENVLDVVERLPVFPDGGIPNFRKVVVDNFRLKKVKGLGFVSCEVQFIIDTDGSITNVKAAGSNQQFNDEAVRAVSKITTKWLPAKINNQNVRFKYRMPLTISYE